MGGDDLNKEGEMIYLCVEVSFGGIGLVVWGDCLLLIFDCGLSGFVLWFVGVGLYIFVLE